MGASQNRGTQKIYILSLNMFEHIYSLYSHIYVYIFFQVLYDPVHIPATIDLSLHLGNVLTYWQQLQQQFHHCTYPSAPHTL